MGEEREGERGNVLDNVIDEIQKPYTQLRYSAYLFEPHKVLVSHNRPYYF